MLSQDDTIKLKFDNSYNGRLFAVQGDTGRTYNLQILSDLNNVLDVSGMKLRLYIGNDKEVSYTDGEITSPEEGKFKVQVYNSQLKYPGLQKAQFVLTDKDGQKIGSKVFDLYVEEGLETGQTLGKNIFVDFETIDETLKLIRNYDKTLEEAKEVDLKLKVDIQEGTETRQALVDCKKKALEIKGQLDTSKTDAGKTLQDLKTTKIESESLKADLESENTKASESIKTLGEKTEEGNSTIAGLGQSTNTAKATKESLDTSNTTALSTKKSLEEATSTANSTKTSLETLKGQGDTLSRNLSSKITSGDSLKTNLDASIDKAARTDATLKSTDTEAKGTEQLLRDLLGEIGVAKEEVQQIIASGDLSKYVTDPKLQEALIDYAKLESGKVPAENLPTMGNGQAGIVPAKNGKFLSLFANELTDMPNTGPYGISKTPFQGGRIDLNPIRQLPSGGTAGQVLKKTETGTEWKDEPDLSGYVTKEEAQKNEVTLRDDMKGLSEFITEELGKKASVDDIVASKMVEKYELDQDYWDVIYTDKKLIDALYRDKLTLVTFKRDNESEYTSRVAKAGFESALYYKGTPIGYSFVSRIPSSTLADDVKNNTLPSDRVVVRSNFLAKYNEVIQSQLKEQQSQSLSKTDIQEFTQQELEEAFK